MLSESYRRLGAVAIGLFTLLAPGSALHASADSTCYPAWKVGARTFDCASRAAIGPGNDTRVNLMLLQREASGQGMAGLSYPKLGYDSWDLGRTFFDWSLLSDALVPPPPEDAERAYTGDSGSRCDSFDVSAPLFVAALGGARVTAKEREGLTVVRGALPHDCADEGAAPGFTVPASPPAIQGEEARAWFAYLSGAGAFYAGDWAGARSAFGALTTSRVPWVAETSRYMLARVELNAAIAHAFDEWGGFDGRDKIDRRAAVASRAALNDYLKAYPAGRYAASARGLLRRAYWLAGDNDALSGEYTRLLAAPGDDADKLALVEEIDNKLLMDQGPSAGALLLAVADLRRMRGEEYSGVAVPTADELAKQKPAFAGQDALYGFVLANQAFYVDGNPRAVLSLIPDDARRKDLSPLAFSRQVLRGQALAALGDRNEGGFWQELLGGATGLWQRPLVELGLAMNWERHGKLADVFADGSPITDPTMRLILIDHSAGPALLRRQAANKALPADERKGALNALLFKELSRGFYGDFVRDLDLAGEWPKPPQNSDADEWLPGYQPAPWLFASGQWAEDFPCPALRVTAQALAANPRDNRARLCLGEFWRLNGFDYLDSYDTPPETDQLGGVAAEFPGSATRRGVFYAAIIADPKASADDKAYALYRAIRCYAPGGNNSCGGEDVALAQRRAWFQRLKRDYPKSRWAGDLTYYW